MKKALATVKFEEMQNKIFKVSLITERLCELCDGVMDTRERALRTIRVLNREDYENLLTRSKAYDRAEVDLEDSKIYFYDHDYPGDVHPSCVEKL